jgi:endoglucanase
MLSMALKFKPKKPKTKIMKTTNSLFKVSILLITFFFNSFSFAQTQSFPANKIYLNGIMPTNRNGQDAVNNYSIWKTNFIEACSNGRYRVKFDNASQTVSEGIGYGMLLSAYAGDQTIFDGLWKYYKDNRNSNGVMNWKINGCSGTIGNNGATDGEVDAAMALIVADYQWGSSGSVNYKSDANTLITAIKDHEVESGTFILKPGDMFGGTNLTNPSYFAPGYFRKFASFTGDTFWNSVATKCYDVINKNLSVNNAVGGLVSDWCNGSGNYSNEAGGYVNGGKKYTYDAARTPWRIAVDYVWYGNSDAKTYIKKASDFARVTIGGSVNIVDGYNQDGSKSGQYHNATFVGAFASAAMGGDNQAHLDDSYTDLNATNEPNAYFNQTLKTMYLFLLSGNFYLPDSGTVTPNIAVTGVSLTPTSASLTTGQTKQLTPTVSPSNATNRAVTYSSSNTGVATVNNSGLVTAVGAGNATITVKTTDGNKTATAAITVTNPSTTIAVTSVSLSPASFSLNNGQTKQLTATVSPSNATNRAVTYTSSNTGVATVNNSGLVTAVGVGNATITVKTNDGNKTATAAVDVTTTQSNSCAFGAPTNSELPSYNKITFNKMYKFGNGGPDGSNFKKFQINWNLGNKSLIQFAYSTANGVPSYYNDLRTKITQNFSATKPSVTITNSGISGLDGDYWVSAHNSNFVMVSKTQGYTLYFSNATTGPSCSASREIGNKELSNVRLVLYPNPTFGVARVQVSANSYTRITDLQGKILLEKQSINAGIIELDLSEFNAGIYNIQVTNNEYNKSERLILQK